MDNRKPYNTLEDVNFSIFEKKDHSDKKPIELIDGVMEDLTTILNPIQEEQTRIIANLEATKLKGGVDTVSDKYLCMNFEVDFALRKSLQLYFTLTKTELDDVHEQLNKLNKALKLLKGFISNCSATKRFYTDSKELVNKTSGFKFTLKMSGVFLKNPKKGIDSIKRVKELHDDHAENKKGIINHGQTVYELIDQIKAILGHSDLNQDKDFDRLVVRSRSRTL